MQLYFEKINKGGSVAPTDAGTATVYWNKMGTIHKY